MGISSRNDPKCAPPQSRTGSGCGLTVLAWANVCLHLAGLAFAALGMSPGTPLASLPERLEYLSRAPVGWTLGWGCWMACAVFLVAFLAQVCRRLGAGGELARVGLMVAVAGAAFDLFCDAVYILVFPMLASGQPRSESLFLVVEKMTGIGSLVIANGFYSIAVLLVSADLRRLPGPGRVAARLGYAVGAAGVVLAAAGFTGVPWHALWATPPTICLFCVWVVLVARSLEPGRRPE